MFSRFVLITVCLVPISAHADEPKLCRELSQFAWMLGDWKTEKIRILNPNWEVGESVLVSLRNKSGQREIEYDKCASVMRIRVAEDGNSIRINYSYKFVFKMLPLAQYELNVTEIIAWSENRNLPKIVIQAGDIPSVYYLKKLKDDGEWQTLTEAGQRQSGPFQHTEDDKIKRWVHFKNFMPNISSYDSTAMFVGRRVESKETTTTDKATRP